MRAVNECFIYFAALAESRRRGAVSDLFQCLPLGWPSKCDDTAARRIHSAIMDFIEKCPSHPNVGSAFRILLDLRPSDSLHRYLLDKLKYYLAQGDAPNVYQLCIVIEDAGFDVFRDEAGFAIGSRSYNEGEKNLGIARRFLERQKVGPGGSTEHGGAASLTPT